MLTRKETTLAMPSTVHVAVTSPFMTSQPSDQNGSSSSSSATAAAAASAVAVILTISGFVAFVVYCRRKKGKKSQRGIRHIGKKDVYSLVNKPRKKRNAPPTVPLQDEGLDRKETLPAGFSDPTTGQASSSQPVHASNQCFDRLNYTDPQEQLPHSRPLISSPEHTYDTVDVNNYTPEDPYYSVPDTNGHGPPPASEGDTGNGNAYEDTVSAADPKAVFQNSVPVGDDDFEDMYAVVN